MKGTVGDPEAAESEGFGCAVNNRFGQLLDDEADPFDILRGAEKTEKKKKKKDEPKKIAATQPPPVKKESQKDRRVPVSASGGDSSAQTKSLQGQRVAPPRGGSGPGDERGERRVGFRERRPYDNENSSLGFSIERPVEGERGPRGRGGERGRGRGMRGGGGFRSTDGFDQRGKREFERHSGSDRTGVRSEEKRGGSGQRNWGSMKDQISDGAPTEDVAEGEEGAEPVESSVNQAPEGEEQGPPAAVEMSLDEWKALQEQSRPKATFNIRKADTNVPSGKVLHKSRKPLEEHADNEQEEDEATGLRRPANDITAKLEINFGSLGRPSRGGRGGGRGRGRGGPASRPERESTSPQKLPEKSRVQDRVPIHDDPEDFPALA